LLTSAHDQYQIKNNMLALQWQHLMAQSHSRIYHQTVKTLKPHANCSNRKIS